MKKGYAIVTGASSGIGYEMAEILAAKGYWLILVARRKDRLDKLKNHLVEKYNTTVEVVQLDLSVKNSAIELHNYTRNAGLDVEILINNAGFGMQCNFMNQSMDKIIEMVQLNVLTLTHLTQLYANDFLKRGSGKILQVSSGSAYLPTPFVASYAASKSYVLNFSEALRFELRNTKVSVTTLYPGYTNTEFETVANTRVPWIIKTTQSHAREVALAGINGMLKGRKTIIPGYFNKFSLWMSGILPRSVSVFFAGKVLEGIEK